MKVMSVFGTRPEMIKMWSTLRLLDSLKGFEHVMVHTGQNFTPELKDFFFRDLELRAPDHQLEIDTSGYGKKVADVISKTHDLMKAVRPDALLVLGDTFSGLSVMPAAELGIRIFHMEAGLRAWDRRMPEQRNRILIDHMADINLPFHAYHRENLLREGLHPSKIIVSGNTTFEAMDHYQAAVRKSGILDRLGLKQRGYVLATAHRAENVDNPETLARILSGLGRVAKETGKQILFPMHPRTRSKAAPALPPGVTVTDPFGFHDFNRLVMDAWCMVSDSGTASEECLYYRIPCVTLRLTTERFETIEAGNNIVSGMEPDDLAESVLTATSLHADSGWQARYDLNADGFAPSRVVVNALRSRIRNFF
jgi:UDP-N-acetylglucosamine 2-epimerase (non-hydrolysing)